VTSDRALCMIHLATGFILIIVAALLNGFGHGTDITTAMFGVGAALLPTAPSGLLRRSGTQGQGTLIPDTLSAVVAGAQIASGIAPSPPPVVTAPVTVPPVAPVVPPVPLAGS
jgi:hypothetical protein